MPYQIDWPDDTSPILTVRLTDPVTVEDIRAMYSALAPTLAAERPAYVLADLSEANSSQLLSRSAGLVTELIPDNLTYHLRHSRLAIVGGGTAISTLLALAGAVLGGDEINSSQSFADEEPARRWLEEQARTGGS
ncbi:MAG: hypothetical protein Kow00124_27510 [Anaerolineae bacterium]